MSSSVSEHTCRGIECYGCLKATFPKDFSSGQLAAAFFCETCQNTRNLAVVVNRHGQFVAEPFSCPDCEGDYPEGVPA